jgi:hypothetical protein
MGSERFELPRFSQTGATTQRHQPLGQLPNYSCITLRRDLSCNCCFYLDAPSGTKQQEYGDLNSNTLVKSQNHYELTPELTNFHRPQQKISPGKEKGSKLCAWSRLLFLMLSRGAVRGSSLERNQQRQSAAQSRHLRDNRNFCLRYLHLRNFGNPDPQNALLSPVRRLWVPEVWTAGAGNFPFEAGRPETQQQATRARMPGCWKPPLSNCGCE